MTQKLDIVSQIPCYKCIILEPTRAPLENCKPNQCQTLTEWIMQEAEKYLPKKRVAPAPTK